LSEKLKYITGFLSTIIIMVFLLLIVVYYYFGSSIYTFGNVIFVLVLFSLLTDGLFLLIHLPRKPIKHEHVSFDPKKLTVVIACYNGEDIIGETIENALVHVPKQNIIVVSDASTDNTARTARSYGVRVVENKQNVNKAFSISFVMHRVKTPYVLILDDDTLIGKTFIPTSLLDEGYDAVAFNVMPLETNTIWNKLQTFEYRKAMTLGKSLRGDVGAVGNISGAIGLYKTADLIEQVTRHSGQFGGEDQQRTAFVHLSGKGKGITYTDATVITKAPDTFRQLFKQRSIRWNLSLPELFFVYMRILLSPRFHYILKIEKAYQMYLLVTEPIRMLFFWLVYLNPFRAVILYGLYTVMTFIAWVKIGRKDPIWLILIYPLYRLGETICRFIAHFYWFKIKYHYLFEKKHHVYVTDRKLVYEYSFVILLLAGLWSMSLYRFERAVMPSMVQYVDTKKPAILAALGQPVSGVDNLLASSAAPNPEVMASEISARSNYRLVAEQGDGKTHIARKAIKAYTEENNITLNSIQATVAEDSLQKDIKTDASSGLLKLGEIVEVDTQLVESHIKYALSK
jgi:cellulose synthase/poly-beta-1,6-N-acetylglucosamine synthase-like glycosyltransferase